MSSRKKTDQKKAKPAHLASSAYAKSGNVEEPDWSLLDKYLPLVKALVGRMRIYFPPQVDIEDIYSVAVSGLITAIRRRDPERLESFSSYAALRIRGAILDELRRMDWMPRSIRLKAKDLKRVMNEQEQTLGRPVTEEEMAQAMDMNLHEYRLLLDQVRPVLLVSMDTSPSGDSDANKASIHEVVSDETELNARERCEKKELVKLMRSRIESLPEVPRKVLMMYYFEEMRLAEIAEVFNLTESRICQIHAQAVIGLKTYLNKATVK